MQAIEYELRVDKKNFSPYYTSCNGNFTPTFFQQNDKGELSLLFETKDDSYPRLRRFTNAPWLFSCVHEDMWNLEIEDFEYLERLKSSVLSNSSDDNESTTISSLPYHPISSVIRIKFESGFELLNYKLSESSYDLIGFSKN